MSNVYYLNSQDQECTDIKGKKKCARNPECKWTGMKDGFCSDRQTWTPSDDRSKPASGCRAVRNAPGCATWSLCTWNRRRRRCVEIPQPPTMPPAPTMRPTTPVPSMNPTESPVTSRKCTEFKRKGGCCGKNFGKGKPCINNQVAPPGCYWNGSKCLPKKE